MKFSTFVTVSLLAVANAATNLRAGGATMKKSDDLLESEVILHGVVGEPTANDLDIIGQALVSSYNDKNWELGHFMTGFSVPFQAGIPSPMKQSCGPTCSDDDRLNNKNGLFVSVVTPIKQSCGPTCSDDDRSILTTPIKQPCGPTCSDDDQNDKAFLEGSFCDKIKSSGSAYLASVAQCSVVMVPVKEQHANKIHSVGESRHATNMEAHIVLQGVAEEASDTDMAILSKALVSSYNDVFWDSEYSMSDVVAPFQSSIPQPATVGQSCGPTCSDDDRKFSMGNKGLFVSLTAPLKQSCGPTCSDDDAYALKNIKQSCGPTCSDDDQNSALRDFLETSFCDKIKASVSPNLANAKMCALVVVAN